MFNFITLKFFFVLSCSSASSSKEGAITTSKNIEVNFSANFKLIFFVKATMPPKADSGSQSSALSQASSRVVPSATPQGFVCLIITAALTSKNSETIFNAAVASTMLLYESSLPFNTS